MTGVGVGAVAGLALLAPAPAQDSTATYTAAQADQGAALYADKCGVCHGPEAEGGEFGPNLKGVAFKRHWGGQPAGGLYLFMSIKMPPGQTGLLGPTDYAAVEAFLMRANGAEPGQAALPADQQQLNTLKLPIKPPPPPPT